MPASIGEQLRQMASDIIGAVPDIIAIIVILGIGYVVGGMVGRAAAGIVEKYVEQPLRRSSVGESYEKLGVRIGDITAALVKAYVFVISLLIALPYMQIAGPAFGVVESIVRYLPRLLGGIVILVYGSLLAMAISSFIGNSLRAGLEGEVDESIAAMIRNVVMVGLLAVFITLALNVMQIGGSLVYSLILGVVVIGVGAIVAGAMVKPLEASEDFRGYAPYARFLVYMVFSIAGLAAILNASGGAVIVLSRLAWGLAIAFGIILVPLVYRLAKDIVKK